MAKSQITYLSGTGTNNCNYGAGTAGASCTFIGCGAGLANLAKNNIFIGDSAGSNNIRLNDNVGIGVHALYTQSGGATTWYTYNVAVGNQALFSNNPTSSSNGIYNTALGHDALYSNTTAISNTATGYQAGYSNTTGNYNTFSGYKAGNLNVTGLQNTFIGNAACMKNTSSYNTSLGSYAGYNNTSGFYNTFMGQQAGYANTTGNSNTIIGLHAAWNNTTGGSNTIMGVSAGNANTTGSNNTFVGVNAGQTVTTNSNNTCIGNGADIPSTYTNCTALGNGAGTNWIANNNQMQLGNSSVTDIWCSNATIHSASDRRVKNNIKENVPGLAFINLLKPVTFHYDIHEENIITGYPTLKDSLGNVIGIDTMYWDGKYDVEKINYTGLIAQQVDSAAMQIGYDFNGISKPKDANHLYGLSYTAFIAPLIKAVQELSNKVDSLLAITNPANTKSMRQNTGEEQGRGKEENTLQLELANNNQVILYQNEPNPFGDNTVIRYFIPENIKGNAFIVFYDMYGKEIKRAELITKGFGNINANTENLASGIYSYSLILNNNIVDNKKMQRIK